MDESDYIRFVFELLDHVHRFKDSEVMPNPGIYDYLNTMKMNNILNEHVLTKCPPLTDRGKRIIHFILYLNMELDICNWIKTNQSLNLHRYLYTRPISQNTYQILVNLLHLTTYMCETIICTPYCFCADLIQVFLAKIKHFDKFSQLTATEILLIAILKCVKRAPIKPELEGTFTSHFNQVMMVFTNDNLVEGNSTRSDHEDEEQKELIKLNGFRLRSILKIYIELINFKSNPDSYFKFPLYELSSLRTPDASPYIGVAMFKKCIDTIMHKCIQMCDFSDANWLIWYEVEVTEEDTNLQASIGHLCFELCSMIDNGYIDDSNMKDYRAVLGNMAIERINFCACDINNIGEMIERVIKSPKCHQNGWIKKLVENHNIFANPQAVDTLNCLIDGIDNNCFKCIVDNCMRYYKSGGLPSKSVGELVYKGLLNMDLEDKMKILKLVVSNYPYMKFYFSNDFDYNLKYIFSNEFEHGADKNELTSKLIWLIIQQPRQMLHLFIAQYVTGICGCGPKVDFTINFVYRVMAQLHIFLDSSYVFLEYASWLNFNKNLSKIHKSNLRNWVTGYGDGFMLQLIKPKAFLLNVLMPLLHPSSDYKHMLYLIKLAKFILTKCDVERLTDVDLWHRLLIQLAKILDDARWTMESYTTDRTKLCEKIIQVMQPLLDYVHYAVDPRHLESIKDEIKDLHLLTRSHFQYLWSSEESVNGMYDRFIMTTQSIHLILSITINRSSSQQTQEEFIFSIASYMPKFTMHEMQNFITNYFYIARNTDIKDTAFFLFECVLNAFMRIIVYMKTAIQNYPSNYIKAWDYLDNALNNFLDCVNSSCMNAIYDFPDKELTFLTSTKILMILKQMDYSRHRQWLLIVLLRLIYCSYDFISRENVSKLLSMIAAIKTTNSSEILKRTTNQLIEILKTLLKSSLRINVLILLCFIHDLYYQMIPCSLLAV